MNVVVLDDSDAFRALLQDILEAAGHGVVSLASWSQLSGALARGQPDIAFVDVSMPVVEGFKVVEIIRRHWPQLPIVLMSGEPELALRARAIASGADDYATKLELPRRIGAIIQARAASRRLASGRVPRPTSGGPSPLDRAAADARALEPAEFARRYPSVALLALELQPSPQDEDGDGSTWRGRPVSPRVKHEQLLGPGVELRLISGVSGGDANAPAIHVGRDGACQALVEHACVSRFHLVLRRTDREWLVEDKSVSGTTLDGALLQRRAPTPLGSGAVLVLGASVALQPYFTPAALRARLLERV